MIPARNLHLSSDDSEHESDDSEGSGDLIRAKSVSLPKAPSNEDVLTQPKAVKAAVMNRLLPDYKSEL